MHGEECRHGRACSSVHGVNVPRFRLLPTGHHFIHTPSTSSAPTPLPWPALCIQEIHSLLPTTHRAHNLTFHCCVAFQPGIVWPTREDREIAGSSRQCSGAGGRGVKKAAVDYRRPRCYLTSNVKSPLERGELSMHCKTALVVAAATNMIVWLNRSLWWPRWPFLQLQHSGGGGGGRRAYGNYHNSGGSGSRDKSGRDERWLLVQL